MRNFCDLAPYLPRPKDKTGFALRAKEMYERRLAMGKTREDVFAHLMGESGEEGDGDGYRFSPIELSLNTRLLIIAGADTTAGVLINVFRELARSPMLQQKLFEEVAVAAKTFGTLDCHNTAKNLPLLQAVIDETCRRWNPVPGGASYQTGPAGATVAGRFIPPNTAIRISHLAMMTDARYFPDGERFWPERWTEHREEGVKDVRAFVPFS
jgi:cytochrome P450